MTTSLRAPLVRVPAKLIPYVLSIPALGLLSALVMALASLFVASIHSDSGAMSADQYRLILADATYRSYFSKSLRIAAYACAGCIIFGCPVAYYMEFAEKWLRKAILMFIVLLLFSDYVMRVYSLILIIGNNGVINRTLLWLGMVRQPLHLMYSELGVVIGLILGNSPFMILSVSSVLGRIDPHLGQAASILGASKWAVFYRIILPLSVPGIVSGSVIVLLLSMNAYLTPELLGGGFVRMIANFVYEEAISSWNYPLAAAAATILLIIACVIVFAINRLAERLGRRIGIVPAVR
jgi:ABC-type spermidine/putrescine transport system permease subunit I